MGFENLSLIISKLYRSSDMMEGGWADKGKGLDSGTLYMIAGELFS